MTRVEEFDSFYDSTRQYVLHQTYALSGDLAIATAAVKDAYSQTWQDWSKLRCRDPLSFVRSESWRRAVLQRSTHLLRRKHNDDHDQELLDALHELPGNARRLLVLQTIGELTLGDAAHEVGVTEATAESAATTAREALESRLGADGHAIVTRLHELRQQSDAVPFERPSLARRRARRRGRRRTVALVAAGVLAVLGAGVVVTQGGPLDNPADAAKGPHRPVADTDELPMSDDDMLDEAQVGQLSKNKKKAWEVSETGKDMAARDDLSTCPAQRYADRQAAAGWVRTFEPTGKSDDSAVQSIEVSRDEEHAERGFARTVRWYADCSVPRLQLVGSYAVQHKGRETVVLQMRKWAKPARTYTVGISRAGVVTSSLVHSAKGSKGPSVDAFSRAIDSSLEPLCDEDDKACTKPGKVRKSLPPETSTATGFLGVIDLPPIEGTDELWIGTDPASARPNLSATRCDNTKFVGKKIKIARGRTYVIPEEKKLTDSDSPFGLSQTVGAFKSSDAAKQFVEKLKSRVDECDNDDPATKVSDGNSIDGPGMTGKTWQLTFEVDDKTKVNYRLGVVRAGDQVAQILFTPVKKFDIPGDDFDKLITRAGERLRTRGTDKAKAASPADR